MYTTLGNNIRSRLKERNLSVSEIERRTGLRQSTLRNVLSGRSTNPSLELLIPLTRQLNCTVEDLLSNDPMPEEKEMSQDNASSPIDLDPCKQKNESVSDLEWSYALYTASLHFVNQFLEKNRLTPPFAKINFCIGEIYKYSYPLHSIHIDQRFAEWLVLKTFQTQELID